MNIDYSNPVLSRALDLIMRDCWKDMEWDDMEVIADRAGCECNIGASKCVFSHKSWDFVLKIPYYGEGASIDYCRKEFNDYKEICARYPQIAHLFAKVCYLGEFGEMPVYAQEKVPFVFSNWAWNNTEETETLYQNYSDRMRKDEDFDDFAKRLRHSRMCKEFGELIIETFGMLIFNQFAKWIFDTKQGDLHNSNVGLTANNKPIVFDFSGWDD